MWKVYKCHHSISISTLCIWFIYSLEFKILVNDRRSAFPLYRHQGRRSTLTKCEKIHSELERLCRAFTAASSLNWSICTFTVKSTSRTCAWKRDKALAVCNGTSTFMRNCLCSAFRGNAKPLMILQTENRESTDLQLWLQVLRYQNQTGTVNTWQCEKMTHIKGINWTQKRQHIYDMF